MLHLWCLIMTLVTLPLVASVENNQNLEDERNVLHELADYLEIKALGDVLQNLKEKSNDKDDEREDKKSFSVSDLLRRFEELQKRPIGKISSTAGKGADYSAGSTNIQHGTTQSGGKQEAGYQKSDAQHSYGAGALNIQAETDVPKVKENLGYAKSEGAGTSQYGAGAVGVETAPNAPKIKHEGLGQVDKTKEQVNPY